MTLPQSSSQQQSQHFLLKWNNHRSNMVNVFESLLQSENLVDVTLAVEGKFLKAHKIVLSACSPYFQAMFVNQTPVEKHPILIFHDMKFAHLKTLLEFMYRGEISIDEKDLSDVLKVAEALSIRGLSSFESDDEDSEKSSENGSGNNSANNNNSNSHHSSGNSHHNNSQGLTNSNHGISNANGSGPPTSGHLHHFQNFSNNSHNNASHSGNQVNDNQYHQLNTSATSNNISCDSSINVNGSGGGNSHSHGHGQGHKTKAAKERSQSNALSSVNPEKKVPAAKKRRGRQPKKNLPGENQISETVKIPGTKGQARIPDLKPVAPGGRQGVRRRIPRRYAGTPSQPPLKREKISDGEHSPDLDPEADIFLSPDLNSSEPLSEMSVRGLDLFKYASIEDGVYRCIECEKLRIPKTFKNKYSFQRHAFLYHEGNMRKVFPCPVCSREFSRPDKMKNHLRSIHQGDKDRQGRGHSRTPPSSAEVPNSVNAVSPSGTNSSLTNELFLDPCDF